MVESNPYSSPMGAGAADASGPALRSFQVKRVDPMSVARVIGAFYAGISIIAGICITLIAIVAMMAGATNDAFGGLMAGLGVTVLGPLFYGVVGAVFGAIFAALYNLIANFVGGVRLELEA